MNRSVIDRRAFVGAVVGILAVAKIGATQPAGKVWRIGWTRVGSPPPDAVDAALREGLRPLGYVNTKTAKTLRLAIPQSILARADRVIQ